MCWGLLLLKDEFARSDQAEISATDDLDRSMQAVVKAGEPVGVVGINPRVAVLGDASLLAEEVGSFTEPSEASDAAVDVHRVSSELPGVSELEGVASGKQVSVMILEKQGWAFVILGESSSDSGALRDIVAQALKAEVRT